MPDITPPRRFTAVVFDFGGVLASSPFDHLEQAGARMGLAPGVLTALMMGDYGEDGDHPWHRLERGEITARDWFEDFLRRAQEEGVAVDLTKMGGDFYGSLAMHGEMVDTVRLLRSEGYRTAILTNNVREFGQWRDKLPLDELFDAVVDSCEVGMRKPDPRIYAHVLGLLGVTAEQTVFLDDHAANVEGARRVGITAIHVGDPAVAVAELRAVLAGTAV